MATENFASIGFVLILIGILIIIIGSISGKPDVKFGFGGFIGPIPFGFANDPRMLWIVIGISAVILLLFILPFLKQFL